MKQVKKCPRCGATMQKVDSKKIDHVFMVDYICKKCKVTERDIEKKS